jgi:hypothetical protein
MTVFATFLAGLGEGETAKPEWGETSTRGLGPVSS